LGHAPGARKSCELWVHAQKRRGGGKIKKERKKEREREREKK